jgi:8-amino-7-oxononanoate synthase
LEIIKQGEQKSKLLANIDFFRSIINSYNFSQTTGLKILNSHSAIQPLIIGDNAKALKIGKTLFEQGFYVGAIRSPTVPKGTERLRITLNANHTHNQIEQLLTCIKNAI